jgi:hypothetical protein
MDIGKDIGRDSFYKMGENTPETPPNPTSLKNAWREPGSDPEAGLHRSAKARKALVRKTANSAYGRDAGSTNVDNGLKFVCRNGQADQGGYVNCAGMLAPLRVA